MCGFAGLVATRSGAVDPQRVARMGATIAHRGPDDDGQWCEGRVGLAFRRLAILDLSPAGHQPMLSDDGQLVLVFNGEIYNYRELRGELEALGHRFRSSGDTEVLLRAYQQWGTACVERFNGMWAFLIHDRARGVVFGSRDRFGVKPLYVAEVPEGVAFASEIKALRAIGAGAEPDWSRVSEWLVTATLDQVPARGRTFFAGIRELPAATAFEQHLDGRRREWTYWSLDGVRRAAGGADDAGEEYAALFEDAIRLQARADVPVAVSLSGGLDSTAIVCALARQTGTRLEAFTYNSEEHDESEYVRATIAWTGAELHPVVVTPEQLFEGLPALLAVHDEPVHTLSAAISWHIMAAARARGIKVMMSGQGSDEVLAGYPMYFEEYWSSLVGSGRGAEARDEIAAYTAAHGGDAAARFEAAARRARRKRFHARVPLYSQLARFARARRVRRGRGWFTPTLLAHVPPPIVQGEGHADLTTVLRQSVAQAPMPMYLRLDDRNSMAHGVEARVPFLDHRLVELAFSLPERALLRGPWNKWVLRESLHGRAPEVVHRRLDKIGFAHPQRTWFRTTLADRAEQLLGEGSAGGTLYDAAAVRRDIARHRAGEIDIAADLFRVVQLELWLRGPGATPGASAAPPAPARAAAALAGARA
jgi:asparagine synthase (glutamine-hydrolysing)